MNEQYIEKSIVVNRDEHGFGLRVGGQNPVFVDYVHESGAAWRAGVRQDDKIIKVNGTNVRSFNHQRVVQLIQECQKFVNLTLHSPCQPTNASLSAAGATGGAIGPAGAQSPDHQNVASSPIMLSPNYGIPMGRRCVSSIEPIGVSTPSTSTNTITTTISNNGPGACRSYCIKELIETERTHVSRLKLLDKLFYKPMVKESMMTPEQFAIVFSCHKRLYRIHKQIFATLMSVHHQHHHLLQQQDFTQHQLRHRHSLQYPNNNHLTLSNNNNNNNSITCSSNNSDNNSSNNASKISTNSTNSLLSNSNSLTTMASQMSNKSGTLIKSESASMLLASNSTLSITNLPSTSTSASTTTTSASASTTSTINSTTLPMTRQLTTTSAAAAAAATTTTEPLMGHVLTRVFMGEIGRELEAASCEFCACQATNRDLLNKLTRRDSKVADFLAQAANQPSIGRLGIKDLLASCFQRLTKYPLLLENLLKTTSVDLYGQEEYDSISSVLKRTRDILVRVNEAVKMSVSRAKLLDIWRRTDKQASVQPIIDIDQQQLLHDGQLTFRITKNRSVDVHVLLMTDYLVILTKSDSQDRFKLRNIPADGGKAGALSPLFHIDDDLVTRKISTDDNAFYLICKGKENSRMYELGAQSPSDQAKWRERIQTAVASKRAATGGTIDQRPIDYSSADHYLVGTNDTNNGASHQVPPAPAGGSGQNVVVAVSPPAAATAHYNYQQHLNHHNYLHHYQQQLHQQTPLHQSVVVATEVSKLNRMASSQSSLNDMTLNNTHDDMMTMSHNVQTPTSSSSATGRLSMVDNCHHDLSPAEQLRHLFEQQCSLLCRSFGITDRHELELIADTAEHDHHHHDQSHLQHPQHPHHAQHQSDQDRNVATRDDDQMNSSRAVHSNSQHIRFNVAYTSMCLAELMCDSQRPLGQLRDAAFKLRSYLDTFLHDSDEPIQADELQSQQPEQTNDHQQQPSDHQQDQHQHQQHQQQQQQQQQQLEATSDELTTLN